MILCLICATMSELNYRYSEQRILDELQKYIDGTYGQHYAGSQGIQVYDLFMSLGIAEDVCRANIIKYASRMGKKNGESRKDIMKILHYAILWLHAFDKSTEKSPGVNPVHVIPLAFDVPNANGSCDHHEVRSQHSGVNPLPSADKINQLSCLDGPPIQYPYTRAEETLTRPKAVPIVGKGIPKCGAP